MCCYKAAGKLVFFINITVSFAPNLTPHTKFNSRRTENLNVKIK